MSENTPGQRVLLQALLSLFFLYYFKAAKF